MRLGLGTGSTARHFVDLLGAEVAEVSTSSACRPPSDGAPGARRSAFRLSTLDDSPELDLTIDGADEIDPALRLIKGGGGALLREKIVAASSRRMVGDRGFEQARAAARRLSAAGRGRPVRPRGDPGAHIERASAELGLAGPIALRGEAAPFVTDGGHYIFDCAFGAIADPEALAPGLRRFPASSNTACSSAWRRTAIVAGPDGVEILGDARLNFETHRGGLMPPAPECQVRLALLMIVPRVSPRRPTLLRPRRSCGARGASAAPAGPVACGAAAATILYDHRHEEVVRNRRSRHDAVNSKPSSPRRGPKSRIRCTPLKAIQPEFVKTAKESYIRRTTCSPRR